MTSGEPDFGGTARYAIRRKLGAGASGIVYEAFDCELRQRVALKTLRRPNSREIYRLKEEFRALVNFHHPNLVGLHELACADDRWFITMDLVEGTDFLSYVWSGKNRTVDDVGRLRAAFAQIVEGVRVIHAAGKLHRDIKPTNILVTPDGHVVLLDFGLVRDIKSVEAPEDDRLFSGTPAYIAPEVAFGQPASEASDWYAVGTMLYEALVGHHPYEGEPTRFWMRKLRARPLAPVIAEADDLAKLAVALLDPEPKSRPTGPEIAERTGLISSRPPSQAPPRPFVGREQELAALSQIYEEVRQNHPKIAFVRGDSGMGKTALVHHFLERIAVESSPLIARGRCYERESAPFKAFDALVQDLVRQLRLTKPPNLGLLDPRDLGVLAQLFPVLERVPGISGPAEDFVGPARERRQRAFAALRGLLQIVARESILVLSVDDLQWADSDSAALFREVFGESMGALRLLFVGTYRSGDVATSPFLSSVIGRTALGALPATIELGPLDDAAASALLHGAWNGSTSDAPPFDSLVRESQGSPYFLLELVRDRLELSEVAEDAARTTTPGRLDAMVERRLARLTTHARQALELIATAGHPLDEALLYRLLPDTDDGLRHVALLRSAQLVRSRTSGDRRSMEPYHDRLREAVVRLLDGERVKQIHKSIAGALVELPHPDPRLLVEHLHSAEDWDGVRRHVGMAAEAAAENLAFDDAARYRRLAWQLLRETSDEQSLRVQLADALVNAGRGYEAAQHYLAASRQASGNERLSLRYRAADQLLGSGRIDAGRKLIEEVLAEEGFRLHAPLGRTLVGYTALRVALRLRSLGARGRRAARVSSEDLRNKIDACALVAADIGVIDPLRGAYFRSLGLLLSLRADEPVRLSRAMTLEAAYAAAAGGPGFPRAMSLCANAERLADQVGTPEALATVLSAKGICCSLSGRWRQAALHLGDALKLYTERCTLPRQWELGVAQYWNTSALYYMGELRETEARLSAFLKQAEDRGDLYSASVLGVSDGTLVWLLQGDVARTRTVVTRAIDQWPNDGFYLQHWLALLTRSYVDLYEGDCASVLRRFSELLPAMRRSLLLNVQTCRGARAYVRGCAAVYLAAAAPRGNFHFRLLARACERQLFAEKMPWTLGKGFLIRAGRRALQSRQNDASQALRAAIHHFEKAEMPLWSAVAKVRLATLGRDAEAGRAGAKWLFDSGVRYPERVVDTLSPWPERSAVLRSC